MEDRDRSIETDRPIDRPIDRSIETDRPIDRPIETDRPIDRLDRRTRCETKPTRPMNVDRSTHPSSIAIEFHRSTLIDRDRDRSRRARARGCMIDDARRVSTRETPTRGVDGNRASSVERGVDRSLARRRAARRDRSRLVEAVRRSSWVEFGRVRFV